MVSLWAALAQAPASSPISPGRHLPLMNRQQQIQSYIWNSCPPFKVKSFPSSWDTGLSIVFWGQTSNQAEQMFLKQNFLGHNDTCLLECRPGLRYFLRKRRFKVCSSHCRMNPSYLIVEYWISQLPCRKSLQLVSSWCWTKGYHCFKRGARHQLGFSCFWV